MWGCVRSGVWAGGALMHWGAGEVMVETRCGDTGGEGVRASTVSEIKINGCVFFCRRVGSKQVKTSLVVKPSFISMHSLSLGF